MLTNALEELQDAPEIQMSNVSTCQDLSGDFKDIRKGKTQ